MYTYYENASGFIVEFNNEFFQEVYICTCEQEFIAEMICKALNK